jgi:membrane fusion protein (multidrug efflux system)
MKTSRKIWIAVIVGLLAVVAVLAGVKAGQIGKMIQAGKSFTPPPETVTTAKVEAASWLPTRTAVGTLVAVRGVTLGAELPGTIREIHFDSGQSVRKGAVLVKLDTSTEEAQLQAAIADAKLAEDNLARAVDLRKGEANTPADLDAARTRATQAQATVATLRTTIAKKTIQAPFDGRVAIRQVELGQVVSPGTPIASLQSVSPIYAEFWLPQQALADVKAGQKVRMTTDTFPGQAWEGTVSTVNTEVDVATRNVRLRATFPNPDGRLRPGMFANVEVLAGAARPVLVIPATAALFAPYGDSVFVLEEKPDAAGKPAATVTQRFVRLGERRGDLVAVESGLKEGDVVVSSGAFKLRSGASVVVRNELAPKVELAPRPAEN